MRRSTSRNINGGRRRNLDRGRRIRNFRRGRRRKLRGGRRSFLDLGYNTCVYLLNNGKLNLKQINNYLISSFFEPLSLCGIVYALLSFGDVCHFSSRYWMSETFHDFNFFIMDRQYNTTIKFTVSISF
eukprot:Pompholyxophrys_sp_v1_NODE_66_length_2530_cov_5.513328.p3 type:complete len:128 gc:universal NODE_66_length_2530_cov_5.513328:2340-1957(-)